MGFCMGGYAAMLAATRLPLKTVVSFYGGGMAKSRPGINYGPLVGEFKNINCPALLFFGGTDHSITPEDVEIIRTQLTRDNKKFEIVVYPEAGHGFFCDVRDAYHEPSAKEAWQRTQNWLAQNAPRST